MKIFHTWDQFMYLCAIFFTWAPGRTSVVSRRHPANAMILTQRRRPMRWWEGTSRHYMNINSSQLRENPRPPLKRYSRLRSWTGDKSQGEIPENILYKISGFFTPCFSQGIFDIDKCISATNVRISDTILVRGLPCGAPFC